MVSETIRPFLQCWHVFVVISYTNKNTIVTTYSDIIYYILYIPGILEYCIHTALYYTIITIFDTVTYITQFFFHY